MDGLRIRVKPTLKDGFINLVMEYVEVINNELGEVKAVEEFRISEEKANLGYSYISKLVFKDGFVEESTFFLDNEGKRHFMLQAEIGNFNAVGQDVGLVKETK